MITLNGIGVSPGQANGRAVVLIYRTRAVRFPVAGARVPQEVHRLEAARESSRQQLQSIKARLLAGPGRELTTLFDAQILMLDDPMWQSRATALIREQHVNAEWAVQRVFDEFRRVFEGMEDPYLAERGGDLTDVLGRLCMNLRQDGDGPRELFHDLEVPGVLIADELTPSMAAQVDWSRIGGFATDLGSRTHHTAILARSLGVPAVVGLGDISRRVEPGETVRIDGTRGQVVLGESRVEPPAPARRAAPRGAGPRGETPGRAVTRDGEHVRVEANLERVDEVDEVRAWGADGIGLYRSEHLLAGRALDALSEEDQYPAYRRLLETLAPCPVTIRTFDIEDGHGAWADLWGGAGSPRTGMTLGPRGVRLMREHRGALLTQLRALARAAAHGELRVMFPFVSTVEEVRAGRALLEEALASLRDEGRSPGTPSVGVMIEVPAAVLIVRALVKETDFLSIGTNDLIQCCLGVDRRDERVAHLYTPLHPGVLKLIQRVCRAAAASGQPLSVCGEMAVEPRLLGLLVGLGVRDFSMSPPLIPEAKQLVTRLEARVLRGIARRALRFSSATEVDAYLAESLDGMVS